MATRKTTGRKKTKARPARRKKAGGGTARAAKASRKPSGPARRRPASPPPRPRPAARSATIPDRIAEFLEYAATGALRRVVESGGRRLYAWAPEAAELRHEAGAYLRELRELAGLTIDDLADAIELRDRSLLEAVEAGTATLSFELILRLAAILARHDPVPFVTRLVRSYNPLLWQLLQDWGVGRLPVQLERERSFGNILRGHDAARALSDEDFAQVLEFTRAAFETALHFATRPVGGGAPKGRR
jgi:transcriptional regulator with XRE-family HTH domain